MRRRAVAEAIDSNAEAVKDALLFLGFAVVGALGQMFKGWYEENNLYANVANFVTILSFFGATVRAIIIWLETKERRRMNEIKRKMREEAEQKTLEDIEHSIMEQLRQQDILNATTPDEIHEALARNSRKELDK